MAKRVPLAQEKVARSIDEMQGGTLRSGSSTGPKVTNTKQGIAIGLSEARAKGAKVPPPTGPTRRLFGR